MAGPPGPVPAEEAGRLRGSLRLWISLRSLPTSSPWTKRGAPIMTRPQPALILVLAALSLRPAMVSVGYKRSQLVSLSSVSSEC